MNSLTPIQLTANYIHTLFCTQRDTCHYDYEWKNPGSENSLVLAKIIAASKKLNIPVENFVYLLSETGTPNVIATALRGELKLSFRNF